MLEITAKLIRYEKL